MMNENGRRPDRRLARNRLALMKSAESLFARRGFAQVTIDEIAETADLAKGTFYRYFDHKEAIANQVALAGRRALALEVAAAQAGVKDPALRVVLGISVFLPCTTKEPARAALLAEAFDLWLRPEALGNERLRKDLADGYRSGRFTVTDLDTATVMIVGRWCRRESSARWRSTIGSRSATLPLGCALWGCARRA
jgi:AcrR family transcriptional regulator